MQDFIGKKGINLSGGQKQKLSIARIFLKNPSIIILDEATSALDYEAEKAVQSAWNELSKRKTAIIIAHRLTTILDTDRVAVISDGEVVSCDHHRKLLGSCRFYQELFQEQYEKLEVTA